MMRVGLALDRGCNCKQSSAALVLVVRGRGDLQSSVEWGVDAWRGCSHGWLANSKSDL